MSRFTMTVFQMAEVAVRRASRSYQALPIAPT